MQRVMVRQGRKRAEFLLLVQKFSINKVGQSVARKEKSVHFSQAGNQYLTPPTLLTYLCANA